MTLTNNEQEKNKFISEFQNPFKSDRVTKIFFVIQKDFWTNFKQTYNSTIHFENGNSKGEQRIIADNFIELIQKTENFIKTL